MSLPGSTEDIFSAIANPKYRFPEKEVPKGSPAFQLIVTNADEEEKADSDTDESGNKLTKPSKEYYGRRRATIGHCYGQDARNIQANLARRGSMMPIPERASRSRSPSNRLGVESQSRTRSLSPLAVSVLRRNSLNAIHDQGVVFGSSKERETMLH